MRWLAVVVGVALGAVVVAMLWQHARYLRARRELVQDRQPLLHSPQAFHVLAFLELAAGAPLHESVRNLCQALEAGGARVVYAGKVALNAIDSAQLTRAYGEAVPWDAIVVAQLPGRERWEALAGSERFRAALEAFARSHVHGMKRPPFANLAVPQVLLARRLRQILARAPSHFPFEPAPADERVVGDGGRLARLAEERELGRDAAVVVNLVKAGTAEQSAADRGYVDRMLSLMAEGGHGPMHVGRAVTLEGAAEFEQVAIVYYPGVDYFTSMAESRFYQSIAGDKQLGDTQASITVPILGSL